MANRRPTDFVTTRTWPAADDYIGLDGVAGGTARFLASNIYGVQGATIASAATVDLSTVTGDFIDVSGTTTITSFGTVAAGKKIWTRFTGALTITHSAALFLPNVQNIATGANDIGCFVSLGSGNWVCLTYRRQNTPPLLYATNVQVQSGTSGALAISPLTLKPLESMVISVSPTETSVVAVATNIIRWRMPYAFNVQYVRASVNVAPVGTILTVDINEGGVSILTPKLTIDISETSSTTALTQSIVTDAAIADDALMSIDVDTAGTANAGLKVALIGNRV